MNSTDDVDETLEFEPKVQLLERNNAPDVVSRIPVNKSSVIYIGSLNRNKRKIIDGSESSVLVSIRFYSALVYCYAEKAIV